MFRKTWLAVALLAGWASGAALPLMAAEKTAPDKAALDASFAALKTFDWGGERNVLRPLEDAVVLSQCDAAARKDLETRLLGVVKSDAPCAAKDFACRQLSLIATADSVPALAALLADKDLAHMARGVLQRIPGPESVAVLREALPKLTGRQQVGVIVSLGVRRDVQSVPALTGLLASADQEVAAAAARSLGTIGTPEAVAAVSGFLKAAPEKLRPIVADACLAGAERLLSAGKKAEALAVYTSLTGPEQPKPVRIAATRGMLAATGKK
jgi:hypothetical protein